MGEKFIGASARALYLLHALEGRESCVCGGGS